MENLLTTSGLFGGILLLYSILLFIIARLARDNSVMDIAYGPAFLVTGAGALYITDAPAPLAAIIVGCIAAWAIRLGS